MSDRLALQAEFETVLGSRAVYFQRPSSNKMQYPCIIFKRQRMDPSYANNSKYLNQQSYLVTVIYIDPDDDLPSRVLNHFQFISQDAGTFVEDGLYHDNFTLYY